MKKAKSRLKAEKKAKISPGKRLRRSKRRFSLPSWKRYLDHLPTLVISLIFYAAVYYLVTHFYPAQLRHFLVANTYSPLQFFLFIGNFFFFSYLFLNVRRGLLLTLWLNWSLFLKLQPIANYLTVSLITLAVLSLVEVTLTLLDKNQAD